MRRAMLMIPLLLIGCAKAPLPTYPRMSWESARELIHQRTPPAFTLQGQLTLSRPGESITLDTVMAVRSPAEMRLRAWKFGQAVFDFTIRPDGVYVYSGQKDVDEVTLEQFADSISPWLELLAPLSQDAALAEESRDEWRIDRTIDGVGVRTFIDRATLVPLRHELLDHGNVRATIGLSRYAMFDAIPWPASITIQEKDRRILLRTGSIGPEVAVRAFEPPRRAQRLPERAERNAK